MKPKSFGFILVILTTVLLLGFVRLNQSWAQGWRYVTPVPQNQRQVLEQFQSQLKFFDDAIRNAPRFNTPPDAVLWQHFDGLCAGFRALTSSLNPAQLNRGANDLADLEAGLAIIGEAFPNFQEDLNNGRSGPTAVRTLCQVLRDSMRVWTQQFNGVAKRLQIGR